MYENLQEASEILKNLENMPLTQEKTLRLYEAFSVTANNIDKMAHSSGSIEDSMALGKLHQGMLACERLLKRIREAEQQENVL